MLDAWAVAADMLNSPCKCARATFLGLVALTRSQLARLYLSPHVRDFRCCAKQNTDGCYDQRRASMSRTKTAGTSGGVAADVVKKLSFLGGLFASKEVREEVVPECVLVRVLAQRH